MARSRTDGPTFKVDWPEDPDGVESVTDQSTGATDSRVLSELWANPPTKADDAGADRPIEPSTESDLEDGATTGNRLDSHVSSVGVEAVPSQPIGRLRIRLASPTRPDAPNGPGSHSGDSVDVLRRRVAELESELNHLRAQVSE